MDHNSEGPTYIHGVKPQFLMETIIRDRICESQYWKEHCFNLNAATIMDKAVELTSVGGMYDYNRPTEFICLALKMLLIQPEKEIIVEYINQEEFKYLRALAAFYLRLVGKTKEIYQYLEPLLKDPRKLRMRSIDQFSLSYIDEFVDSLLREDRVCDVALPHLTKRDILEDNGELELRVSALDEELEGEDSDEERGRASRSSSQSRSSRSRSRSRSQSRSRNQSRSRSQSQGRSRSRTSSHSSDRSPRRHRGNHSNSYRSRSRSRSRSNDSRSVSSRSRSISR